MTSLKLILLIEQVLLFSQKNPALSKKMTEAYHNEALRKQRIVDKKHAALARMKYAQVLWIVVNSCSSIFFDWEFKLYVYGKRQTSDSSWELLKIENEQKKLKTVQKILMDKKLRETSHLCVEIMNCACGLNFIRLLRVVITPSERRKRLEAIGWNSG